jgi:hypothetical protein
MDNPFAVAVDSSTMSEVERFGDASKAIVITNQAERDSIYDQIKQAKTMRSKIVAFFAPSKKKADDLHAQICKDERSFTDRLDSFEKAGKQAILVYDQAQKDKAEVERRRLQAIEDETKRKERERISQEAARQRQIEEEARKRADEARRAAEAASAAERARLLKEAEAADRKAAAANVKAEQKQEEAAAAIPTTIEVATSTVKQAGESKSVTWKARVIDANLVPREWLIPDEMAINTFVRATKGLKQIPGVEIYPEQDLRIRK